MTQELNAEGDSHEDECRNALKAVKDMSAEQLVQFLYSHEATLGDLLPDMIYQGDDHSMMNTSGTILNLIDIIRQIPQVVEIERIKKEEMNANPPNSKLKEKLLARARGEK